MLRMLAGALALVVAVPAVADDKKDDKDFTVWVRETDGLDLKFKVGKGTAKFVAFAGDNGITVTGKLTEDKGVMTFEITDVKEEGTFPQKPKKGEKFSFKWEVKGDTATISDLKGDIADEAKPVVGGEYKKKK